METTYRDLELLGIELGCILRNEGRDGKKCDRNCEKCDLVQDTEELIGMYRRVIHDLIKLKEKEKRAK